MTFIWPVMLVFLCTIPMFVALYFNRQQKRRELLSRYGGLGFLQGNLGKTPGIRRHIPLLFFLAGFTLLLIALARPQATVNLPKVEGTIILAFDVSGSMAAEDLAPTRMEAAKAAARDFVQRQPSTVEIGVVAFSDGGLSVQAPTDDQETILAAINRLTPQRGTSIGQGILISLNTIREAMESAEADQPPNPNEDLVPIPETGGTENVDYSSAAIVLLTDGENTAPPDPFAAAQESADHSVRIYTIGIGSAAGTTLHVNGFTVHTRLNESTLEQISEITGGAYYNAENEDELRAIYDNLSTQLVIEPEEMEVTSIFTGVSILILLIGGMFSLLWFNRMP